MQKRYEAQLFVAIAATNAGYRAYPTRQGNIRIYAVDLAITVTEVADEVFIIYPLRAWKGQVIVDLSSLPGPAVRW